MGLSHTRDIDKLRATSPGRHAAQTGSGSPRGRLPFGACLVGCRAVDRVNRSGWTRLEYFKSL